MTFDECYHVVYLGVIKDDSGSMYPRDFGVRLVHRKEYARPKHDWCLYGMCGKCDYVQSWANSKYRREFEVELSHNMRWDLDNWRKESENTPLPFPTVIKFYEVEWGKIDCTVQDSVCGGQANFSCQNYELIRPDNYFDEPTIIEAKP